MLTALSAKQSMSMLLVMCMLHQVLIKWLINVSLLVHSPLGRKEVQVSKLHTLPRCFYKLNYDKLMLKSLLAQTRPKWAPLKTMVKSRPWARVSKDPRGEEITRMCIKLFLKMIIQSSVQSMLKLLVHKCRPVNTQCIKVKPLSVMKTLSTA